MGIGPMELIVVVGVIGVPLVVGIVIVVVALMPKNSRNKDGQ